MSFPMYQGCAGIVGGEKSHEDRLDALLTLEKSGEYIAEPKEDGIWIAVMNLDGKTKFISRSGKEKKQLVPIELPLGTIVVGEAAYGSQTARKRRDKLGHDFIQIHDCLMYGGEPISEMDGEFRQNALQQLYDLDAPGTYFRKYLPQLPRFTKNFVEEYLDQPEGLIIKPKVDHPYLCNGGKAAHWMKSKKCTTNEYVILGFELSTAETKKDREMCKYITVGGYVPLEKAGSHHIFDTKEIYGKMYALVALLNVGAMHHSWCMNFAQKFDQYKDKVCEIGHFGLFDSGACRHPYFMRLRDDRLPTECLYRV